MVNQGKLWKFIKIRENPENSGKFLGKSEHSEKTQWKALTSVQLVDTKTLIGS